MGWLYIIYNWWTTTGPLIKVQFILCRTFGQVTQGATWWTHTGLAYAYLTAGKTAGLRRARQLGGVGLRWLGPRVSFVVYTWDQRTPTGQRITWARRDRISILLSYNLGLSALSGAGAMLSAIHFDHGDMRIRPATSRPVTDMGDLSKALHAPRRGGKRVGSLM